MKKVMIFFAFINMLACKAQNIEHSLFIFTDKNPVREISDGSFVYQKFDIDFEPICNSKIVDIKVNKNGILEKNIKVKATTNKIVSLIYKNQNADNNNSRQVNQDDIVNFLTYDEIICNLDIEEFMKIASKFNIYIIQGERNSTRIYLAKKVTLERHSGM
ncbi:MAG TPA: hypothetical protein VFR70_03840 [Flavobacterium sp.]|nr:hypothetical protein [Flavobacterium sp.]